MRVVSNKGSSLIAVVEWERQDASKATGMTVVDLVYDHFKRQLMANIARVNKSGGPVSWSISINHLMVARYQAFFYDTAGVLKEKWDHQRTDDDLPDRFKISTLPPDLQGCVLLWEVVVMDPTDKGGQYVGTVTIDQDGNTLCVESAPGVVPAGNGKVDIFAGEIEFE